MGGVFGRFGTSWFCSFYLCVVVRWCGCKKTRTTYTAKVLNRQLPLIFFSRPSFREVVTVLLAAGCPCYHPVALTLKSEQLSYGGAEDRCRGLEDHSHRSDIRYIVLAARLANSLYGIYDNTRVSYSDPPSATMHSFIARRCDFGATNSPASAGVLSGRAQQYQARALRCACAPANCR